MRSFALLCLLAGCSAPMPRASGLMGQEAYVWQRRWTPAVGEAVRGQGGRFERLAVLGAEVSWVEGRASVVKVELDEAALAATGRPVVMVLRIGHFGGPFEEDDARARLLAETARSLCQGGLPVEELQVDFDAGTGSLEGYGTWLRAIRRALPEGLRLGITGLPTWTGSSALPRLLGEVDGWTLQVHSFRPPGPDGAMSPLVEPEAARRAVEVAGELGLHFRVALPTYAYEAGFSPDGVYLGARAEGESIFPPGTRIERLEADPVEIAGLVAGWMRDRPEAMQGLAWFRLPTAQDEAAWAMPTLERVMMGEPPAAQVQARGRSDGSGLVDVLVESTGEAADALPVLRVEGPGAVLAADGLGGYRAEEHDGVLILHPPSGSLRPGDERMVGWVRFERVGEVKVDVVP